MFRCFGILPVNIHPKHLSFFESGCNGKKEIDDEEKIATKIQILATSFGVWYKYFLKVVGRLCVEDQTLEGDSTDCR